MAFNQTPFLVEIWIIHALPLFFLKMLLPFLSLVSSPPSPPPLSSLLLPLLPPIPHAVRFEYFNCVQRREICILFEKPNNFCVYYTGERIREIWQKIEINLCFWARACLCRLLCPSVRNVRYDVVSSLSSTLHASSDHLYDKFL